MQSTITDRAAPITREQLRTFHVAGRGIEFAAPAGSLRPAVLDQLQQLPPFESADLRSLYQTALTASRGAARTAFLEKVKAARWSLQELLALDALRAPESASPEFMSAALGSEGAALINAVALSAALRESGNTRTRMDAVRRSRIEAVMGTLDAALQEASEAPPYYAFEGARSFESALAMCDRQLLRFAEVLRALRTARLEQESFFDPSVHPEALQRLDWQAAAADELLALPPVVVFETADRLAEVSLTSFGRVLRSGRPIQILVTSSGLYAGDLSGSVPDFGYLSIAHREAFVLQSSVARPEHLTAGLQAMTGTLRPAVAVIAIPEAEDQDARLASSLLHLSRAFPLYRYDPDRGAAWPERFELLIDEELPVTAADFAAVSPNFRRHFRLLPADRWNDEQMELGEYLEKYVQEPPLAIPFLWVNDAAGAPQRAVVSRELVNLCRDRQRAWKIFEELSGAGKAAASQSEGTPADGQLAEKARLEGAADAIYRAISLVEQACGSPVETVPPPSTAAAAAPAPEQVAATPVDEASALSEDPYIDSFLCTSCNDCFKINPRVFQYDGNKQAFIADARAGTFAELVKAAEGCPAKCIHPGSPRPDDTTATPQLLAKAAKLR